MSACATLASNYSNESRRYECLASLRYCYIKPSSILTVSKASFLASLILARAAETPVLIESWLQGESSQLRLTNYPPGPQ